MDYELFSANMSIKNKSIKFGMKIWVQLHKRDTLFSFQVYTEKDNLFDLPIGERVVNNLTKVIQEKLKQIWYFDNFFSFQTLYKNLATIDLRCTGAIQSIELETAPLLIPCVRKKGTVVSMKLLEIEKSYYVNGTTIGQFVCKAGIKKLRQPILYEIEAQEKGAIIITQSRMVGSYNKHIEVVDILDRFLSDYRPRLRNEKWWWFFPIF